MTTTLPAMRLRFCQDHRHLHQKGPWRHHQFLQQPLLLTVSGLNSSLVPRPSFPFLRGRGKRGLGIHCLRMRQINHSAWRKMATFVVCRFCSKEVENTHSVALFSPQRLINNSNSVLEAVFEVKVCQCDEMPRYACRKYDRGSTHSYASF